MLKKKGSKWSHHTRYTTKDANMAHWEPFTKRISRHNWSKREGVHMSWKRNKYKVDCFIITFISIRYFAWFNPRLFACWLRTTIQSFSNLKWFHSITCSFPVCLTSFPNTFPSRSYFIKALTGQLRNEIFRDLFICWEHMIYFVSRFFTGKKKSFSNNFVCLSSMIAFISSVHWILYLRTNLFQIWETDCKKTILFLLFSPTKAFFILKQSSAHCFFVENYITATKQNLPSAVANNICLTILNDYRENQV